MYIVTSCVKADTNIFYRGFKSFRMNYAFFGMLQTKVESNIKTFKLYDVDNDKYLDVDFANFIEMSLRDEILGVEIVESSDYSCLTVDIIPLSAWRLSEILEFDSHEPYFYDKIEEEVSIVYENIKHGLYILDYGTYNFYLSPVYIDSLFDLENYSIFMEIKDNLLILRCADYGAIKYKILNKEKLIKSILMRKK